jgi:hypothetical protein
MSERIKLDPPVNRRVIFKLCGQDLPMDGAILGHDDSGYWVRGGTLAEHLKSADSERPDSTVQFLEFGRLEWLQAAPENSK